MAYKYRAFISYSNADKIAAAWLFNALDTYRVPHKVRATAGRDGPVPARLYPIFRDREEFPASSDLGTQIEQALEASATLVVVCSPNSAKSHWVNEEILTFKRMGREGRILALIIGGEPNADGKAGINPGEECFPEALRYRWGNDGNLSDVRMEPIAADAREHGDGRTNAKLKVIAGILGINYDALKRREETRQWRRSMAAAVAAATLSGGAIVYGWLGYDTGTLSAESVAENSTITVDGMELGSPIKGLKLRSGAHKVEAAARDHFESRPRSIDVPRRAGASTRFWLESGFEWEPYASPAIQSGLVLIPNGPDTIAAHNELGQIVFISSATGNVLSNIPTPAGQMRSFQEFDLGGGTGRIILSGYETERGLSLLAVRASWPLQQPWEWHGPAAAYDAPGSLALARLARPDATPAVAVAGRDGRVFLLDAATGQQIGSAAISDQPLAAPPLLIPVELHGKASLAAFFRLEAPAGAPPLPLQALLLDPLDGVVAWRRDLAVDWKGPSSTFPINGVPHTLLWNDNGWDCLDLSTGKTVSHGQLPSPIIGAPGLATSPATGEALLAFQFRDPALPMTMVRAATAETNWQGPAGLSPLRQPRSPGGAIPRTPGGLLLINLENALAALDPADGRIAWKVDGRALDILIGDWDGDGHDEILVGMSGTGVICLDGNGHQIWSLRTEDRDVRPWAFVNSIHGGKVRDILVHRHASVIGVIHGPRTIWEQRAAAGMQATPVVATTTDGKSIIIEVANWGLDQSLRAFDAAGGVLWAANESFSPNRGVTLADLDGDGVISAIGIGGRPGDDRLHLLSYRPADGKLLRAARIPLAKPSWMSCAPAVADFRGTGKKDVAFTTWDDRSVVVADGRTGEIIWRRETGAPNMQGIAAGDLDGDGKPDVVAASFDGNVYAWRGVDGTPLWKAPIDGGGWANPVIATLTAGQPPYVLVVSATGYLFVIDGKSGDVVWAPDIGGNAKVTGHPVVADVGTQRLILAPLGAAGVVAFDWPTRKEVWRSPEGHPVLASPALADFGGSKNSAVVVASATGDIMVLKLSDGSPIWQSHIDAGLIEADPVVADLDGDGVQDILIAGYDFKLRALSGRGTVGPPNK